MMVKNEFPQTFSLRLPSSMRRQADKFAQKEGISLNQFIMLAVAEKLTRMKPLDGEESKAFGAGTDEKQ